MKGLLRLLGIVAVVGVVVLIIRAIRQNREESTFEMAPAPGGSSDPSGPRSISPELLSILADPADKGPVELMTDGSGKEWLVNRRNGFRYPVEDGIPIMLIEEGEKYKDESLIQA